MRVLVACESSGIVRDAFIEEGHDAISCDLVPSERPGPHIQDDVTPFLRERWDLVIAHPPCTYLSRARGVMADVDLVDDAIAFFRLCLDANAPRVAVENPIPFRYVSERLGWPSFKVDPFHFGDDFRKRTWWWTVGLPPLLPSVAGSTTFQLWCPSKSSRTPGLAHSSTDRSRFWPGMARAMAIQWGRLG